MKRLMKHCEAIVEYIASMPEDADADTGSEHGMGPWVWGPERRVKENSALLGGITRNPFDSDQRISFFQEEKNRVASFFEPDYVYSFDFVGQ